MNFEQQAQVFLAGRTARNRQPIKPSTLSTYKCRIDNHILPAIGSQDLVSFGNGAMKTFAQGLTAKGLAPKTVQETVLLVQLVVASAISEDGDRLYPRDWNYDFLDLPPVVDQKQPTLTPEQLKAALADKRYGLFYALLAGTGMRVGEAQALRYGIDGKKTGWDPRSSFVDVRTSIWRTQEGSPKTQAAVRQIDVNSTINDALSTYVSVGGFAKGARLFPASLSTIRKSSLEPLAIEGFHTFRRFRTTHLRSQGVPEDLVRFWMGHAGTSVTDRYSKLAQNVELRKTWAEKAGLGFEIK